MAQKGPPILVTNVVGDGPRLKIWGVVDKQNLAYIEKIINVLSKKFVQQGVPDAQNPVPNTICCVKYRGSYARAKVCSVQPNGVVVQLIDSGIVDILPKEVFRFIHPNSNEESMLLSAPPLAAEFTLANIVSINEKWESRCIETILSFIKDKELEVSHYDIHNNRYFVKLVYGETDIGNMLVNKRMAVMATLEDMFNSKMYSQQPPYKAPVGSLEQQPPAGEITTNGYSNSQRAYNTPHVAPIPVQPIMGVDNNWRFNNQPMAFAYQQNLPQQGFPQQGLPQQVLPQQSFPQQNFPPQNILQRNVTQRLEDEEESNLLEFRGRLLEVGQTYRVLVSYVDDGPNKFSVQIESMKGILMDLMSNIQAHETKPLREPPLPGSVCLARLRTNKCICRAVVMATMETQLKIYYVDFGHTDTVPYSDIYQLPPKFINPRVLSVRFCLSGLKEMNITEEAKKYFKDLIQGKDVELHVCEPEGPFLIQYGDLYFNSKNIKDYLIDRFPDIAKVEYGHLPPLTDGTKETVHVSYVASCSRFFVQLEKNMKDIEEMMSLICEYAADAPPMTKLAVGSICIAPYDVDNQWYRVKIVKIQDDKVSVLYVDYGNEETVSRNQLRDIRRDLVAKMPCQAVLCALNGFANRPSNKKLDTEFENLVFEKRLSMQVMNAQPGGLVVDLFDIMTTPAKCIHTQLIKMSLDIGMNLHNDSNISTKSNESYKTLGERRQSDEMDGHGSNPFRTANNDRFNSKSWKDDHNEQRHDNRYQRRDDNDRFPRDGGNNPFNRDGGNNPFNRDGGSKSFNRDGGNSFNRDGGFGNDHRFNRNGGNDRFNRDTGNNRFGREGGNDRNNFRDGGGRFNNRDDRSGGGRFGPNKQGFNPDKCAASDSESTSSRGSGKRGDRGDFQDRRGSSNRPNFNKFGNDNDGFKPRRNDENSGNTFKPRSARDDSFGKPKEIVNFDTCSDISEPKKWTLPQPAVSIGGTNNCELIFLTSPSNFYIHQVPQNAILDELMEGIASAYEKGGTILPASRVKPDLACIAQFADDERWYRAIIKRVEGDSRAVVFFVDYGNVETVGFDKLKEIKEEYTYLPIQAVHCKLFGPRKTDWTPGEIDAFGEATNEKYLQAEFIGRDKDVYQVLLREIEDEVVRSDSVNEAFCPGVDLLQEKEALKNRGKVLSAGVQKIQPDYAPMNSKWKEEKVSPGKKEAVLVTWFENPDNFYCQSIAKQREFRPMMEEIQDAYSKRQPVSSPLQPGSSVITIFPEDGAFYRAEILEVTANRNYIVQYVDFGNSASVDQRNVFPVEKKYMSLPKQAIRCSLKNVIPVSGGSWSSVNCKEIDRYFDDDNLECTYHEERSDKYLVSLSKNGKEIADTLVAKKLALSNRVSSAPTESVIGDSITPRFDIKLLPAQTLRAKVSNVESVSKFYVQFSTAEDCNEAISSYMTNKDPTMLALPSQLAVMQNQAIECSLYNVQPSSTSLNEKLKNLVEDKDVIIYVEQVDNNRLIVQLYDPSGIKIQLTEDAAKAKISPVCPMPILSSTHQVAVSYANHSNSLWLQMLSDTQRDDKLHKKMREFYSLDRENVVPVVGTICALKNLDGSCCRATIIRKTAQGAFVNLIDYGVNEEAPLDRLKVLDSQFYVPHQLAIHVSLNVTLVGTPAEQAVALKPHLKSKLFTATFYNVHKKWIVDLVENGVKLSETLTALNLIKAATNVEEIQGGTFKAAVTHCDSPAQFWLQRSEDTAVVLELQEELQNAVESYPAVDTVLEEGTICAAIFDGFWYRAQIIDAGDDISTVRFIDYGNPDVITNKTGKIKEVPEELKARKAYAMKCRLNVVPGDAEDWSEETCARFSNLVIGAENLETVLISPGGTTSRVDLFVDGKSVCEILVEEGLAAKVEDEEDLVEEIIENELDPRSAFISHINSPSDFFVQEEKSVPDLEKIQDRFLVADMLPEVEDAEIVEGLVCVAKYTDDNWYRARVISRSEAGTELLFIDYGNLAVSTQIRAIPDDVSSIPPLSRKCSLQLPNYVSSWPDNALESFCQLAAEGATIFLMDVIREGETTIVKLTLENEDVAEKLAPPQTIFISHINSPSDFWVQKVADVAAIDKVKEQLLEGDNYTEVQAEEGLICAAKFPDDEQWYRAKVISHNENSTLVLFIDYGNTSVTNQIRAFPEDLLSLAPFARRCSLQLPNHAQEWPEDAFDQFCQLAGDGIVPFFLDVLEENEIQVVNLICGKESIAGKLVPEETRITCTSSDVEANFEIEATSEIEASLPPTKVDLISVYISQLSSPSEFWIQEEKNFDAIQKMEDSLLEADGFSQLKVEAGLICAAKFPADSLWYRAKVLSQDESGITVSFVDYGNSSGVADVRTLPDDVKDVEFLAKRCSLKLPENLNQWPEDAFSQFLELSADGTTCFGMDVLEEGETAVVNLYLDGESVADKLTPATVVPNVPEKTEKEVVAEKEIELAKEAPVSENKTEQPEEVAVLEKEILPEECTLPEDVSFEANEEETVTKSTPVEETLPISVYISQLTSPSEFWVQEENIFGELQNMEDSLVEADGFPQLKVEAGLICAAKFPADSLWYRAKVLSQDESGITVSFVDYGNSSVVTDVRTLPENVKAVPALAKKCSLKLPENINQWPDDAFWQFLQLSADGTTCFAMKVLEEGETALVRLHLDGENVADKLVPLASQGVAEKQNVPETDVPEVAFLEEEAENTRPKLDSVSVYISHLNSPKEFWVQEEESASKLEEIEKMLANSDEFPRVVEVKEGLFCAAQFPDDSLWYRAKVVDLTFEGESVADKLIASVERKLAEKENAVIGDEEEKWETGVKDETKVVAGDAEKMRVCNVVSASKFWGQVGNDPMNVEAEVSQAEKKWLPLDDVIEDMLCAAKLNGEWQRARVKSVDNGNVEVFLIDQGYTVLCTEFRELPSDLASVPPLSRKYSLKLPEGVEEWSPAATAAFSAYSGTCFSFEILEEAEVPVVRLFHQGEDIVKILSPLWKKAAEEPTTGSEDSQEEFKPAKELSEKELSEKELSEKELSEKELSEKELSEKELSEKELSEKELSEKELSEKELSEKELSEKELPEKEKQILESSDSSSFHSAEENSPEKELTNGDSAEKVISEPEENIISARPDDQVPKTPSVEKIVPGSVSRGLSETEMIHESIERCSSVPPEEKIVPGSIARGDDLPDSESDSSSSLNESEPIRKSESAAEMIPLPTTPKISYDERIVAAAVSSGESPVVTSRPLTPKMPHSEKIVAGVVNLQEQQFLESEVDEVLEVHVQDEEHS
ncbi:maternal protein tudor isoform X2 [Belonocnema kinseyi]|uniref:maternal protein tudor isoform X2 n=1 Tax=Belonocnema kinseyi TaxID=2817044 RepID=UPI00143D7398|nr:maternal protein tudor isoform X2 [Belonocnema kinseyi]